IVSKASEDLPEPDRPVNTTSRSRGRSRSTFLRLCSRAPRMESVRPSRASFAPPFLARPFWRPELLSELSNRSLIPHPLVPAKAGTQRLANSSRRNLDSRLRGNERWKSATCRQDASPEHSENAGPSPVRAPSHSPGKSSFTGKSRLPRRVAPQAGLSIALAAHLSPDPLILVGDASGDQMAFHPPRPEDALPRPSRGTHGAAGRL